jgi:hypothetical protein
MLLRISASLCVQLTQNSLTGSNEATQSFIGAVLNGGVPSPLLMPSAINGLRSSARGKPCRRSNPCPAWQTDSPKKSKARLLVLSEKLQFPCIGHTRGTTMLEKQIDEIR